MRCERIIVNYSEWTLNPGGRVAFQKLSEYTYDPFRRMHGVDIYGMLQFTTVKQCLCHDMPNQVNYDRHTMIKYHVAYPCIHKHY